MFDIGWPEMFLVAVVVLLVVGPKELPNILRNVGKWISKAKVVTREFRTHVDDMIRESELDAVQQQIDDTGQGGLESIKEGTIGFQDDVKDALEFDADEYADVMPDSENKIPADNNDQEDTDYSTKDEGAGVATSSEEALVPQDSESK